MEELIQSIEGERKKIEEIISDELLRQRVAADYNLGNYESSISKAFEFLEESIISSSPLKNPDKNNLDLKTSEELRAVKFKLKGAMNWFKEPDGQTNSHAAALQIITYVDLQLSMLKQNKN